MCKVSPDIIARLKRELLPLQGYKPVLNTSISDIGLGAINYSFPNHVFPLAVVHEFICDAQEDATASSGFIAGILASLMKNNNPCLWIAGSQKIFPAALATFGIQPDRIIFINLQKERDVLWVMEEALKCEGLAAVIGELKDLSFTESRRLQLAVEQSKVTGFILRCNTKHLMTTACIASWKINSLPSLLPDDMPGVGFPRWQIELLKVRNGKTGKWEMEWVNGVFRPVYNDASIIQTQQRKTG